MYPVADVELTVREPVPTRVALTATAGWANMLDAIRETRAHDGAPDDLYYFGLVAPADSKGAYCGMSCITGLSFRPGPDDAVTRVSLGLGYTGSGTADVMAHELGHAHGRSHAPCGGPKDPDPAFPYPQGQIGVWGYDGRADAPLRPPTASDVMSYCSPRWVSDYTYRGLADRSAVVNRGVEGTVALAKPLMLASQRWRTMVVDESGLAHWGGNAEGPPPGTPVQADLLDGLGAPVGKLEVRAVEVTDTHERIFWVPTDHPAAPAIMVPGAAVLAFDDDTAPR
jgi:hypothetical protein